MKQIRVSARHRNYSWERVRSRRRQTTRFVELLSAYRYMNGIVLTASREARDLRCLSEVGSRAVPRDSFAFVHAGDWDKQRSVQGRLIYAR